MLKAEEKRHSDNDNGIDFIFDCEDCDTYDDTWNWDENLL